MKFEIQQRFGHYELFVDGKFYGSYDTMTEAANEIEDIRQKEELQSA